ncbi:MAG: hypothetical protein FD189_2596, partial [Elusimicrobia bacterium]
HLENIYEDLNLPALSREALTDALAHDPCHLLRGSSKAPIRPSKSARKLEGLIREHGPNFDPAHFGLRPILPEYGTLEIERIPQPELLSVLRLQMERDQAPHPMQILALLDAGALRTAALRFLQEFIQAQLLRHLEPLVAGAPTPLTRMSPPARAPFLPSPARILLTPEAYPHLDPTHLADNLVVLDIECGTRATPAAHQNVPILLTLADYHGHIIFNAGVKPSGGVPAITCPAITGLSHTDVATFPSFEQVYPFLLRFFSPQVVILGHGLDADFTALGFRVPASRVLDTAMFLGLRALALDMCRRTGRIPPRSVTLENPGPVGLAPLVEALTGIRLRTPSTPHDSVAD